MADIDQTLKTVLETATGVAAYALEKPLDKAIPCVVYMRVSDGKYISHSGNSAVSRQRFQITCLSTSYSGLRTLVNAVEGALLANTSNWSVSLPLEGQVEDKDEKAEVYTSIRDYYIWNKLS